MKTIKTANGFKKIEDWNADLLPLQLRTILQEHRATLIDKLFTDLDTYIDYKFNTKVPFRKMEVLKLGLDNLKSSGIDVIKYAIVFDTVKENEFTFLDNSIFYKEIDATIKSTIFEHQLFSDGEQLFIQS